MSAITIHRLTDNPERYYTNGRFVTYGKGVALSGAGLVIDFLDFPLYNSLINSDSLMLPRPKTITHDLVSHAATHDITITAATTTNGNHLGFALLGKGVITGGNASQKSGKAQVIETLAPFPLKPADRIDIVGQLVSDLDVETENAWVFTASQITNSAFSFFRRSSGTMIGNEYAMYGNKPVQGSLVRVEQFVSVAS